MTAPILSLRAIRKSYGSIEVLHGVDLDIDLRTRRPVDDATTQGAAVSGLRLFALQGVRGRTDTESGGPRLGGAHDHAEGDGLGHDHRQHRERRHLDQDGEG